MTRGILVSALKERYAKKPFRVILEGTHSAGKSTLSARLAELLDIPHHGEVARSVLAKRRHNANYAGCSVLEIMTCQDEILSEHHKQQKEFGVIDRSVASVIAYSLARLATEEEAQDWLKTCVDEMGFLPYQDTVYLLVHPTPPLVNDGVREAQWAKRELIHYLITGLLTDQGIEYCDISIDGENKRLVIALELIYAHLESVS